MTGPTITPRPPRADATAPRRRVLLELRPAWQQDGHCAQTDPEAFFPEKGGHALDAKRVCWTCPVQAECLEYALENDERYGVWGGLSEYERRRIRRTGKVA